MKLKLRNIGKIKEADIELNGITVLAGENDTGKSTVGKTLYCIFNSFYNLKEAIAKTRKEMVSAAVYEIFDQYNSGLTIEADGVAEEILKNKKEFLDINDPEPLEDLLRQHILDTIIDESENGLDTLVLNQEVIMDIVQRVEKIVQVPEDEVFLRILQRHMDAEFRGQISNFAAKEKGKISLQVKDRRIDIEVLNHKVTGLNQMFSLKTRAVYLDDPFLLDELNGGMPRGFFLRRLARTSLQHRDYLKMCLLRPNKKGNVEEVFEEIIVDHRMDRILAKINGVCNGDMNTVQSNIGYRYLDNNEAQFVHMSNVSTGIKTFIILKELLKKGYLEEKGLLILDEPEIHLHPRWQLVFAELIVALQKEYSMHILLNTHSPYFLRAIEVYSAKYKVADQCKYYLSDIQDEAAIMEDVTTQTDKIYKKLALPFETLQMELNPDD